MFDGGGGVVCEVYGVLLGVGVVVFVVFLDVFFVDYWFVDYVE